MTTASKIQAAKPQEMNKSGSWQYRLGDDGAEIQAYVGAKGWETVLTVHPTSNASAQTLAAQVIGIINENQTREKLLHEALETLESVIDEGLNFSTEQEAEIIVDRIKATVG